MKNQPGNMKNQPGTMKNHENRLGTMENRPGTINKQKRYKQTDTQNLPLKELLNKGENEERLSRYREEVRVKMGLPPLSREAEIIS